ncbi:DUF2721 domain-containing protein [Pantanalinema rosaneae CENA516]|uniref:DUF2721 domain-containing protein n=1 Tax=Pantanalinema rosaneae TaxID=1620701 RepID=UPI003D6E9424
MSVEQSTQLIQLILNSILISVACALVLGGLTARQAALEERLQLLARQYYDYADVEGSAGWRSDRLSYVKKALRQVQYRCQISHYSVLAVHYALLFSIVSVLILAFRTAISLEWLIPVALACFIFGIAIMLLGVGLTLIDLHLSDRPLLEDMRGILNLGINDDSYPAPSRPRRSAGNYDRAYSGRMSSGLTSRARRRVG